MSVEDFSQSLLHAAQCLKVGNHAEASSVLRKLQDLDGTIGVDVATQVLKETPADGVVATYVHFAALRLLRFILIGNWVFWSTQKDNVVNFLYEYIRDRMTVLIQSLWKPVLRESCMVLAIVFKLGCIRTQGAGGVDEEATQRLVDFLRRQSFNAASGIPDSADCEVSTTRVDVLRRLLIICTVEEFGLYEPAAAERGVPMAHHEASHAVFATKGVPAFLSDLLSEALRPDSETRLSASYLFRALSTLLAWRGISLQDEDTGAQTLDDGAGCFEADQASWHSLYTIGVPNGPLAPVHLADILWRWYELTRVVSDTYAPLADAALHHSVVEVTAQCCGIYCERAEASTLRGSASSNSQEEIAFASRLLDVVHRMVVEKLSFRFPLLPVEPLAMIAPHLVLGRAADGEAYAGDDGDLLASLNGIAKLLDNFAAPGGAMCNAVFASQVAHVVSHIFMQLIHGCRLQPDTNDLMAALDAMLGAWRGVIARNIVDVTGSVALPPECRRQLQQVSGSAFSTFVSAKTQLDSSGLPEVESGEGEALSCSQIKLMAFLGQQTPEESCELMIQTLATIAPIYLPTVSGGGTGSVAILHDRMWTTLVVAAGLIGEVVDSERVTIPSCFLELVDRRQLTTETNPVLRLALGVFSFAEQLRMFYSSGTNSSAVSPAVVTAVLTFVEHYVSVYVDTIEPAGPSVNSDDYLTGGSAYSRGVFQAAFDCGKDVLRAALRHVVDSLRYYPFDEGVASGARAVLERLCEKQHHVARWVCAQPEFLALSELALGTVTRFGGRVRGHVIGCLVSLTLADASVLGAECPALKVLESMLLAELGSQRTNDLLEVMDNLRGVFTALRSDNAIDASFPFLSQLVHRCIATAVAKENERQVLVAAMELVYDMFYSCSPFLRPEMSWQNVSIVFAAIEAAEQSLLRAGSAALLTGGQSADSEEEERTRLVRALGKTLSSVSEWATLDVSLTKEQYNEVGVRIVKGISVLVRLLDSHLLCIPQVHDVVFQSLADVSNSFTSHFVTANESLSLLEALHFAAYASSVELNRCALAIIDNISSFLRDSGRAAGSAGLLLDFLLAALEMLVGGRISGSLARKQVTCLISLCESLGVDTVREVFVSTASRHPSFAAVLEALYTTLSGLPMTNMDRRAFTAQLDREVHEAIVTIKGTRIV